MNRSYSFDTWSVIGDREVDVRVVFNATPGDSRAEPSYPDEIEDLDVEATGDTPPTASELEAIRRDSDQMDGFKNEAYKWVQKNRSNL